MDKRIEHMKSAIGFIAALDQSGGSTPKTLVNYGIPQHEYDGQEALMFDLVHAMRVRIMKDPSFVRPHILGAILFEKTMRDRVGDKCSSQYLWQEKSILPFLKIDVGLASEQDGGQMMKPIPNLNERLEEAKTLDVFGTKMRSVIKAPNPDTIKEVVKQQFELAKAICAHGLIPIVEPEIDIHVEHKTTAEELLREELRQALADLPGNERVIFKLTLPDIKDFYSEFAVHPRVVRLAALSGGYSQTVSISKLKENNRMIASFSRALTEELRRDQPDEEFSRALRRAIQGIAAASAT